MNTPKWTAWIIVQQDGDHLLEYDFMLRSIIKSKLKLVENNRDLVRILIYNYDKSRQLSTILELKEVLDEGPFSKKIQRFTQIEKLKKEESDIYNENVLAGFIKKYKTDNHKNIVLLWGHGNAFGLGYFSQWSAHSLKVNYFRGFNFTEQKRLAFDEVNLLINTYLSIRAILSYPLKNDLLDLEKNENLDFLNSEQKEKIDEEGRFQQLTAAQLSKLFISAFNKKIDILLVNSCYMQILESAPFFSSAVKYMVGCQTTFPFLGYDFENIFDTLHNHISSANSDIEIKNIAAIAVKNLNNKYKVPPFKTILKQYYQEEGINYDVNGIVSVSAIDFEYLDEYLKVINDIGTYLDDNFESIKNTISDVRSLIKTVIIESPYKLFIDAENFFSEYNKKDKNFKPFFLKFTEAKKIITIYKKANKNEGKPKGLSLLLPNAIERPEINKIIIDLITQAFEQSTPLGIKIPKWGSFLIKWLNQL